MFEEVVRWLFRTSNLTPHGFCLAANPAIIWLHAISDILVGLTYFSIPFTLITFMMKRRDILFRPVVGLFAAFILLCGTGHFLAVLTLWIPAYGIEGIVKAATAIVSIGTAIALWRLLPLALALPTPAAHRELGSALSELQRAEEGLVGALAEASAARDQAERANRTMKEFVANISHEIRTPMSEVMGLSYLLGRTRLDGQQGDLLAKIERSTHSLLGIINDVLDLSKIEAGEIVIANDAFVLRDLVQNAADVAASRAADKRVAFELEIAEDLPVAVAGDSTRLTQILTNLLANAVKFTDKGRVRLTVQGAAPTADGAELTFIVADTGIGFEEEVRERLFAPFVQADMSITRRFGGTGLGLSIVKRLTDLMGGSVSCISTPGVGSEFVVHLPMTPVSPGAVGVHATADLTGQHLLATMRILVADDSDIVQDVTRRLLELEGAEVVVASNGREAIDLLLDEPGAIHAVLMDIQMPVLDGYEATALIRQEPGLHGLPVIGLTASALSSQRERAFETGMNDFVSKPFTSSTLLEAILKHVKGLSAMPVPAMEGSVPPAAVATAWPAFDGLDSRHLREQIDGDSRLFLKLLRRLCNDFADLDMPPPDGLDAYAARLHKLKGVAATLGATRIRDLATSAEDASLAGDVVNIAPLIEALKRELGQLRIALAESPSPGERTSRQTATPAGPAALDDLVGLLRRRSLLAIERFEEMRAAISAQIGPDTTRAIGEHIDGLRFDPAADLIEQARLA